MRIAINAISAKKGGIRTYTANLLRELAARNVDFWIGVPQGFPSAPQAVPMPASEYGIVSRLAWEQTVWPRHVRNRGSDVLFSSANFGLLNSPIPQVLMIREVGLFDPLYLSSVAAGQGVKAAILREMRRKMILASARQAEIVLTPTQATADMVLAWDGALRPKFQVNPYGTLLDRFAPSPTPRAWAQDGTVRLLYVSVYYAHKVPGIMAQAVRLLSESGMPTQGTITMSLDEISRTLGSSQDMFLVRDAAERGELCLAPMNYEDLPSLYHQNDVFVFPSVNETFGHPLVEAMASGIPVIAADIAVHREVCGDCALYFPPFSPQILADQIQKLANDPVLRQSLIDKARRRALDMFAWNDHVERLLDVLTQATRLR